MPRIAFAGMTHLGLCSSMASAAKGFETICFDPDAARVAALNHGDLPVAEPGLEERLTEHRDKIFFTDEPAALSACDLVFVAPDVPTDDAGQSDLGPIEDLISVVEPALGEKAALVVLSQVPPGFTRARRRDRKWFYYQVETLVFGRAVERAMNPERFIVGCADPRDRLPPAYREFLDAFDCPILPMRYESAELAKISINCCLAASVSIANTLAELCERIGADWTEIAPALKLDQRIGEHAYLGAGLGIAGGNLERDLSTVLRFSAETGSEAGMIEALLRNSRHRRDWALRWLHRELLAVRPDAVIGVLGLAYKENTDSIKNSPALALIERLHPWAIRVHDPVVPSSAAPHPNVTTCAEAADVADGVDALVLMTPWPEFRRLEPARLARAMRGSLVLDPYHLLDAEQLGSAGLNHFALGVPPRRNSENRTLA